MKNNINKKGKELIVLETRVLQVLPMITICIVVRNS